MSLINSFSFVKNICHTFGHFAFDILIKSRPRILYSSGWLGKNNLGDEALLIAYKQIFNKFNFLLYPEESRFLNLLHRIVHPAEIALLAGGTLINRDMKYLRLFRDCMDLCEKGIVFGTGVADPNFWQGRHKWKDTLDDWKLVLERCQYVGVRGPRSQEILSDIGIDAEVIGDPVIAIADNENTSKKDCLSQSICFNVGHSYGKHWGNETVITSEFTKLAKNAKKAGWKIRWIVVWPSDRKITMKVASDSNTESDVYEVYHDPKIFMDLVRNSSVFVGMKLHAVVLATCAYVPSIMIEYRPKCRDYMRSIDQEYLTIRSDQFSSGQIWELVMQLSSNRHNYSCDLFNQINNLKAKQILKATEITQNLMKN